MGRDPGSDCRRWPVLGFGLLLFVEIILSIIMVFEPKKSDAASAQMGLSPHVVSDRGEGRRRINPTPIKALRLGCRLGCGRVRLWADCFSGGRLIRWRRRDQHAFG